MQLKTYSIIEIDSNDKTLVLASGVSRSAAIARLTRLRETYGKDGLRFVMYHDNETLAQHDRRINREYKASLRRVQDVLHGAA